MAEFFDLPTLVIIGVAIFILMRLRSVLGTRTGHERPPKNSVNPRQQRPRIKQANKEDVVVPLHPDQEQILQKEEIERAERKFEAELEKYAGDNAQLRKALADISDADENFTPKNFIDGAGSAYEMIVTAFAQGDKSTLKNLLEKDVYDGFVSAIDAREAQGHSVDFTFVALPNIQYLQAELDKRVASLTLRFDAQVVSATKDTDGRLIEGHEERVVDIADEWTFSRNTRSRDPNWKLVATDQIS
ncbi:MAG: Tim44/TimA family putative adaptor protein [Devosiaceae bacterium]|nr:Tim44/TimA family putative adaptor protein [Devosiaceae bacterium]